MESRELSRIFLDELAARGAAITSPSMEEELQNVLGRLLATARERWPDLTVAPERVVRFIAERVAGEDDLLGTLGRLHVADLYLTCGCLERQAAAFDAYDSYAGPAVGQAVRRLSLAPHAAEELGLVLREELLFGRGKPPVLGGYSGRGSLRGWLRVVAARTAMRMMGQRRREVPALDFVLRDIFSDEADPELAYMKRVYREEFKEALTLAMDALSVRQRNLIKQSVIDGLSVSQLGAFYGVHRATAAKWVARAKQLLRHHTEEILKGQLGVESVEYRSIMRLINSNLDLTLQRFFTKE